MDKLRLSKSAVGTYSSCPKKYYYNYIEKIKQMEQKALTSGIMLHEKYEQFYSNITIDSTNQDIVQELNILKKDITDIEDLNCFNNFEKFVLSMYEKCLAEDKLKYFFPLAIEKKYFDPEIGFSGVIDAVFQYDDMVLVVDWKNSPYKAGKEKYYRFELAGYKHLWDVNNPENPCTHWGINFLKTGDFWFESFKKISLTAFYKKLERTRAKIDNKEFEKIEKNAYSPCKWCGYFDLCWEEKQ